MSAATTYVDDEAAAPANDNGRDPDILDADGVAALIGLDRKSVYEGAARREIPSRRVGRRVLFSRRRILAWLHDDSGSLTLSGRGSPRREE